jgi:hypothetical protein
MTRRNITQRLRRLESRLAPPPTEILQITVTRIGHPEKIIELRLAPRPKQRGL